MKKGLVLLLFSFLLFSAFQVLFAEEMKVIAKVKEVKGKVYLTDVKSKKKHLLEKDSLLVEGIKIKTEKNSNAVIEFNNGIFKYLPPETEIYLIKENDLKLYQETESLIEEMSVLAGTKAGNNKTLWVDEETETIDKINQFFNQKEYWNVLSLKGNAIR